MNLGHQRDRQTWPSRCRTIQKRNFRNDRQAMTGKYFPRNPSSRKDFLWKGQQPKRNNSSDKSRNFKGIGKNKNISK